MTMGNKKNVPAIRFKGFAEEWNESKMGRIGIPYNGLSGKTKDDFGHGDAKFITYMNVFSNPVSNLSQTENVEIDNKQNSVKYGDILFTVSSETPDEVGMSSVWLGNEDNIYLNSFCFGYRLIVHKDPYYMAYVLRSKSIRKLISLLAQGISRYNISKGRVMEIALPFPDNNEQKAIGNYFQNIDKLIVASQTKLDKLKNIKKACLEKMFPRNGSTTPEIRFKGFTDEWDIVKIKELCSITTGKSNTQDQVEDGAYPFFIRSDKAVRSNRYLYDCEAVLTIGDGNIGKVFHYVNGKFDLHQRVYKMDNFINILGKYFYYYFSTMFYERAMSMTAKATVDSIRLEMISEMNIMMPISLDEQSKIAGFFSELDDLIAKTEQQINKLKNIKRACLDKMFVNRED